MCSELAMAILQFFQVIMMMMSTWTTMMMVRVMMMMNLACEQPTKQHYYTLITYTLH